MLLFLGALSSTLRLGTAYGNGHIGTGEDETEFPGGECPFPAPWASMACFGLTMALVSRRFAVRCGAHGCELVRGPAPLHYLAWAGWTATIVHFALNLVCGARFWSYLVWLSACYLWFSAGVAARAREQWRVFFGSAELDSAEIAREVAAIMAMSADARAAARRRQRAGLTEEQMSDLLPESPVEADVEADLVCAICLEPLEAGQMARTLPRCSHRYHSKCLADWLTRKAACPLCRAPVLNDEAAEAAAAAAAAVAEAPAEPRRMAPPLLRQQGSRRVSEVQLSAMAAEDSSGLSSDEEEQQAQDEAAAADAAAAEEYDARVVVDVDSEVEAMPRQPSDDAV